MKKGMIALAIMSLMSTAAFAAKLDSKTQDQAFEVIASLDHLNGSDIDDTHKFLAQSDEKEVAKYISGLMYDKYKTVDNPNSMDLEDLRISLGKKNVKQLIAFEKSQNVK